MFSLHKSPHKLWEGSKRHASRFKTPCGVLERHQTTYYWVNNKVHHIFYWERKYSVAKLSLFIYRWTGTQGYLKYVFYTDDWLTNGSLVNTQQVPGMLCSIVRHSLCPSGIPSWNDGATLADSALKSEKAGGPVKPAVRVSATANQKADPWLRPGTYFTIGLIWKRKSNGSWDFTRDVTLGCLPILKIIPVGNLHPRVL